MSSVSSADDIDFWKVTAPADVSGRLLVDVAGVGDQPAGLRVRIVDAAGQPVGAAGHLTQDGNWRLEVAQPQASQEYFIRVSVDPNSAVGVGNYVASAEFTTPASQMTHIASGNVSSSMDEFVRITVNKSKLHRFDLSANGSSNDEIVKLTIYDAHTKEMRLVVAANSDVTRTGFAWLAEGDYILRFTAMSRSGADVNDISFSLAGDGISDDQGPEGGGDGDEDDYDPYYYEYQYYYIYEYMYEYDPYYEYQYYYDYYYP